MLSLRELSYALAGVWRLGHFDRRGLTYFDATRLGFWRSFWAAVLLLPAWLFLVTNQNDGGPSLTFFAAETVGYVVGWLAYALLALRLTDLLGRSDRYCGYMAAYNWFQLAQAVVWVPATLVANTGLLPMPALGVLWLACYGLLMAYNWFIARHALDIGGGSAFGLVIIDFLLGLVIGNIADSLARMGT